MGPLGAADTLLSITQLICEAELGPGEIAYQVKQLLLNGISVFSRAPTLNREKPGKTKKELYGED